MPRKRLTLAGPALVMALAMLAPALATAADGQPNFSGTYTFVPQKSDDLRAKIAAAVGPDYTVGSKKSEQARVWIRSWLEGIDGGPGELEGTRRPEKRILTIEHTATEFHSGMGDEVNIYYFGREAERGARWRQPEGLGTWQGARSSPRRRKPRARAASRPSTPCSPAGSPCWWTGSSSTAHMEQPLSVRLAFDRVSK